MAFVDFIPSAGKFFSGVSRLSFHGAPSDRAIELYPTFLAVAALGLAKLPAWFSRAHGETIWIS
jgi:hypothetical protein